MSKPQHLFSFWSLLSFLLLSPLYALYGALTLVRSLLSPIRFARRTRSALASEIHCPNGHANSTTGRFECASCRAVYHGWVGACGLCGAPAGWIVCSTCGVGIRLPWEVR